MKNKILASALLIIFLFNVCSALVYGVFAEENETNETDEIDTQVESENIKSNSTSNNEVNENTITEEDNETTIEENNKDKDNNVSKNELNTENIDIDKIDSSKTNESSLADEIDEVQKVETIEKKVENTIDEDTLKIKENEALPSVEVVGESATPTVEYQAHVQDIGWQNSKKDGETAGTSGQAKRVEALKINLKGVASNAKITYQAHVQDIGWQGWKKNGELTGTSGQSKRVEAIRIKVENLPGYSVEYRVHIQDIGWQRWKCNGAMAGTEGEAKRIEAIQIRIVKSGEEQSQLGLNYQAHVQDIGWQSARTEGMLAGTSGQSKRVEAIKINLENAPTGAKIQYRTHIQDIGWQGWKANGELSGTEGRAKRIEAIQIKLQGLDKYTVEYQVHIQDYGWSGWFIDGETAGTVGQAKRIEAIRIRVTSKYYRSYKGIDLSKFNGNSINWDKVKASGVQFAILRIGYRGYGSGKIVPDNYSTEEPNNNEIFLRNAREAKRVGIPIGVYFFTEAVNSAEGAEEATWVVNQLKANNISIQYPIVIDTEDSGARPKYPAGRADLLDKRTRTNAIVGFCNRVQQLGYTPMVYASRDWFYNNLEFAYLTGYDIWLAHYTGSSSKKSNFKYNYHIWQYTSGGSVSGISGNVDMNIGYKRY